MEVCTLKTKKQKLVFITGIIVLTALFFLISAHITKADNDSGGIGNTVGWALKLIFDGGLQSSIKVECRNMWKAVYSVVGGSFMTKVMNAFSGIACSILILVFLYNAVTSASKDMLTLEKLVIMFVKLLAAFCFLLYLPEIINIFLNIGHVFFSWSGGGQDKNNYMEFLTTSAQSQYGITEIFGTPVDGKSISEVLKEVTAPGGAIYDRSKNGFSTSVVSYVKNADLLLLCVLPGLLCLVCKVAGIFLVMSNGLMIIVRVIFSPFPVAQLFSDHGKDVGSKYLRSLLAEMLTMGAMMLVLWGASALQGQLVSMSMNVTVIDSTTIRDVLSVTNLIAICVPQLAAIGGMAGAGKLMREVTGA